MAGRWSIEKVSNKDVLWIEQRRDGFAPMFEPTRETADGKQLVLNPRTSMLILYLAAIGIEEISKENHEEVFMRIHMLETAGMRLLRQAICLSDIRRNIGLVSEPDLKLEFQQALLNSLRKGAKEALVEQIKHLPSV